MDSRTRGRSRISKKTNLLDDRWSTALRTHGRRAGDVLLYSSTYLALIAVAQVGVATLLLGLPVTYAPLVVGLVTFAVYTTDRITDADTDRLSDLRRATFVRRYHGVLYVLATGAYGVAVAVSLLGGPLALAITLFPGVLWVLYASKWITTVGPHFRRLKGVLLVNTTVVALAWAVALTLLPLAFADAPLTPTAAVVFLYFFLGVFVNVEIPNVRDRSADERLGIETLPTVLGVRRTRQILYGIDLLTGLLVGYAAHRGYLPVALAAGLFVGLVYSSAVTACLGRRGNGRLLTLAAESEYVVVAVALAPVVLGV